MVQAAAAIHCRAWFAAPHATRPFISAASFRADAPILHLTRRHRHAISRIRLIISP